MARSKSIAGSNPTRAKAKKEQVESAVSPEILETKTHGETFAEVAPVSVAAENAAPRKADFSLGNKNGSQAANGLNGNSESPLSSESNGSENRKFEVMKAERRKNLVPINLEDEIRQRAYELYEQRGANSGSEADDWFAAEREVRQRYRQQSA